jgi:hypothetical protein
MASVYVPKEVATALAARRSGAFGGRTLSGTAPQARVDYQRQSVFYSLISLLEGGNHTIHGTQE